MDRNRTLTELREDMDYEDNRHARTCPVEWSIWAAWAVIMALMVAHAIGG